jgi:hypothetical protein
MLCYLDLNEILTLRRTSRSANEVLDTCAPSVSRHLLNSLSSPSDAKYIAALYPMPHPCYSQAYLLQMLRRNSNIMRMIKVIVNFIQMKIYMIKTGPRVEHFTKYRDRLVTILYPGAWTVQHFLESYRRLIMHDHSTHALSRFWGCPECDATVKRLVDSYPAQHLIPAFHFFQLILLHLRASSRAPTYAGTIERKLRGWSRKPPADDDLAQLVVLGGIDQLSRISIMKGTYNQRLEMIHAFMDKVASSTTTFRLAFGPDGSKHILKDSEHGLMSEVDVPYDDITESVIENLPSLNDIMVPEFQKRILEEGLVEDEEALNSPFRFVQNVMVDEGEREGEWQYHVFSQYGMQRAEGRNG